MLPKISRRIFVAPIAIIIHTAPIYKPGKSYTKKLAPNPSPGTIGEILRVGFCAK